LTEGSERDKFPENFQWGLEVEGAGWELHGFAKLGQGGFMEAYCVKCKASKEIKDAQRVTMKNGRPALKGKCPDCGTGLYRILKP
jgi:hypothetical protein